MKKYGIFGASAHEVPALAMARSVLGVGRDAEPADIRKAYRRLALRWHPDKHHGRRSESEATEKMTLFAEAHRLLTDPRARIDAELDFLDALRTPFVIGERLFCLGSFHGVRIYRPTAALTEPSRMLPGPAPGPGPAVASACPPPVVEQRGSVLEDRVADLLETFYGGKNLDFAALRDAFFDREHGGLDDLDWIRSSDLALHHFLERRFEESVEVLRRVAREVEGNVIFEFRLGLGLEALAASRGSRTPIWRPLMHEAIDRYEWCLAWIRNRTSLNTQKRRGRIVQVREHDPRSRLTVSMQLADAYRAIGRRLKARALWKEVWRIAPEAAEAREKGGPLRFLPAWPMRRSPRRLPSA